MKRFVFTLLTLTGLGAASVLANNLLVQNVSLTGQNAASDYTNVQFDVSWDNSWRDIVNWDAAWVFVKYKGNDGLWKHATLSTTNGNHTAPTGSTINASSDGKGVFIYRNAIGNGSNGWTTVRLRWNYGTDGLADNALVTVKVFGIEMVYVPQGNFKLGDGSAGATTNHFYDAGLGSSQPFSIVSQSSLTMSASGNGNLWSISGLSEGVSTDANFPTGYNAFYYMKYEVTQEQYVDFLNSLTRIQQAARVGTNVSPGVTSVTNRYVLSNTSTLSNRCGVRCDAAISGAGVITFYCDLNGNGTGNESADGQNLPCNYSTFPDGLAYADWAALRIPTELEYEKAARGGDLPANPGEYAWGSTVLYASAYSLSNSGSFNEVITSQPASTGNALYTLTKGTIDGPVRAGVFALTSTSRQEAGASYYGIMEFSGSLPEHTVMLVGSNSSYTGNHGDGTLGSTGDGDESGWPSLSYLMRGGYWGSTAGVLRISDRSQTGTGFGRMLYNGGVRSVRTAP